ncbi:MAG: formate/nitrite transporter family protein [Clostridiales bacterium]|nr:formate/nitrite transporter family protein [Clostridiales bacterium]
MRKSYFEGIAAGIYIGIGGAVFLACDNRYLGAVFFTVALLSICLTGMQLYTGKVGMIVYSHTKSDWISLLGCLLGNLTGTLLCAFAVWVGVPSLKENALTLIEKKLAASAPWHPRVLFAGILCGILMYTAVWVYKQKNTVWGILFCVPVFILAGFEHSIADMFYFFCAGSFTLPSFCFLLMVVLGNSVGGMIVPLLYTIGNPKKKE